MNRSIRVWSVLFAIVCIVVSAAVFKFSDGLGGDYYKEHGRIGEPLQVNDSVVTVEDLSTGEYIADNDGDRTTQTPGIYVAVQVLVQCPNRCDDPVSRGVLHAGDREYQDWTNNLLIKPTPGYQTKNRLIFEIDPSDLGEMVLEVSQTEIISGYQQHGWIDLETAADAARLRTEAKGKAITTFYSETEVIP